MSAIGNPSKIMLGVSAHITDFTSGYDSFRRSQNTPPKVLDLMHESVKMFKAKNVIKLGSFLYAN